MIDQYNANASLALASLPCTNQNNGTWFYLALPHTTVFAHPSKVSTNEPRSKKPLSQTSLLSAKEHILSTIPQQWSKVSVVIMEQTYIDKFSFTWIHQTSIRPLYDMVPVTTKESLSTIPQHETIFHCYHTSNWCCEVHLNWLPVPGDVRYWCTKQVASEQGLTPDFIFYHCVFSFVCKGIATVHW